MDYTPSVAHIFRAIRCARMLPERHGFAYRVLDRSARPGHLRTAVRGGESGSRGATLPAPAGMNREGRCSGWRAHDVPRLTAVPVKTARAPPGRRKEPGIAVEDDDITFEFGMVGTERAEHGDGALHERVRDRGSQVHVPGVWSRSSSS